MYEVNISDTEIEQLSNHIIEDWYMHFWRGTNIIAIVKGRKFMFDYENKNARNKVLDMVAHLVCPKKSWTFQFKDYNCVKALISA